MTQASGAAWPPPSMPPSGGVFVSYSHAQADADLAARIVAALKADGIAVWWDGLIPVATDFDVSIDTALHGAGCVLVLWTEHSVQSRWVKAEARAALEVGTLLSVLVGSDVRRPVEFSGVQGLDFRGGGSHLDAAELHAVVLGVRSVLDHVPFVPAQPRHRRRLIAPALALSLLAVAGIAFAALHRGTKVNGSFLEQGGTPRDVVVTTSAIWTTDAGRQLVFRRDRKSGASPSAPVPGASELAHAPNGTVAVSASSNANANLVTIVDDDMKQRVFDTGAPVDDMAMDNDTLWVVQSSQQRVVAIDLNSGEPSWTAAIPRALSTAKDDHGLWVTADPGGVGELLHLDPSTGTIIARTVAGTFPTGITTLGDQVWIADEARAVVESYDQGLHRIATVATGAGLVDLASDGRRIWVSSSASSELVVIDPVRNKVITRWSMHIQPFKIDGLDGLVAATSPQSGRVALAHL
jgi:hypothetical protein